MDILASIVYWLFGVCLVSTLVVSVYRLFTLIREPTGEPTREPIRVTATLHTLEIPFETVVVPIHSISQAITVSSAESCSIKLNRY